MEGLAFPQFVPPPGEYSQGPFDVLDYEIGWEDQLPIGDMILTSLWSGDAGLTVMDGGFTGSTSTVWISGGVGGYLYRVVNLITTTGGRTLGRQLKFKIKSAA
jgi:hypothetical protein